MNRENKSWKDLLQKPNRYFITGGKIECFPFLMIYLQFLNILQLSFMIFASQVFVFKNKPIMFTLVWTVSLATLHLISERSVQLNALFQQVKWLVPGWPCSSFLFFLKETRRKIYFPCHSSHTKSRLKRMLFWPLEVSQLSEPWESELWGPTQVSSIQPRPRHSHTMWRVTSRAHPPWRHSRSPRGCSPRGSPRGQCHPAGAGSCIWSPCKRSCPLCTRPRAPPDGCGTWGGCSRPSGPAQISSSESGSGRGSVVVEHGHPLWVNQLWSVEQGLFIAQACWDGRSIKKEIYSHREMFCQHLPSKSSCIYITELIHTSFIFITKQLKNSSSSIFI